MKRLFSLLLCLLLLAGLCLSVGAEGEHSPRLLDSSNLLSASEQQALTEKLNALSEENNFDLVIITVDTLEGREPRDAADDLYDYGGYGMGAERSGVLLLLAMQTRDWWISTRGEGIDAIDPNLDAISDRILPDLSDGSYYNAFSTFADLCVSCVSGLRSGGRAEIRAPFNFGGKLIGSLVIGAIIAAIVCAILSKQLKSVTQKQNAADYVRPGSLNVTQSRDIYLYSNVTSTPRVQQQNRSGGTHISSSGAHHGGGGGKF